MTRLETATVLTRQLWLLVLSVLAVASCKQEQVSHDDIVKADLLVIIDSLGSPCGEVLKYQSTDELGYTIHCKSGDEYVISVNPQGRVGLENRQ